MYKINKQFDKDGAMTDIDSYVKNLESKIKNIKRSIDDLINDYRNKVVDCDYEIYNHEHFDKDNNQIRLWKNEKIFYKKAIQDLNKLKILSNLK